MSEISFLCKCRLMKIHCRNNASTTSSRSMLYIFSAPLTTVGDCLTRKSTCYRFQGPAFMTDPSRSSENLFGCSLRRRRHFASHGAILESRHDNNVFMVRTLSTGRSTNHIMRHVALLHPLEHSAFQ